MLVQLLALVVHRHHPVATAFRNRAGNGDGIIIWLALRKNEITEFFPRKSTRLVKHGDVEIFVEIYLSLLERSDHFFVPRLKFRFVQPELLDRDLSLLAIPPVGCKHATDVE